HNGVRVEVRGLRKSYDGQLVLKGIDLAVEREEIFVIMGPSGSGKSVLLKHIIGLETPEAGEILIEGESIQAPGVMDKYRLAMVLEPQLILYDEPTSELDPLMAVVIGEEILNLKRRIQVTSIVVSHDRDLAFGVADRIAMMHEGQLIAIDTPERIKQSPDPR